MSCETWRRKFLWFPAEADASGFFTPQPHWPPYYGSWSKSRWALATPLGLMNHESNISRVKLILRSLLTACGTHGLNRCALHTIQVLDAVPWAVDARCRYKESCQHLYRGTTVGLENVLAEAFMVAVQQGHQSAQTLCEGPAAGLRLHGG